MYDVIIIGGGPAGCAAAVYAARKKIQTLLITESFGGQSIVSDDIQNWIGEQHISGFDLAQKLENHVRSFEGESLTVASETAQQITTIHCIEQGRSCDFEVRTDKGFYTTKSIILALGAGRRKLGVPGEKEFDGKGVAYCSTCDAPLFRGKDVAVVGGGNAGLEAVIDLLPYAKSVVVIERGDSLRGDAQTLSEVQKNKNVRVVLNAGVKEIKGSRSVESVIITDLKTKKDTAIPVGGVFVEMGSVPNSFIVKDVVNIDQFRQVIIDAKYASTSMPGIFAAGDITDDPYKQNNISAGDGVRAALSAYAYIQQRQKLSPAAA